MEVSNFYKMLTAGLSVAGPKLTHFVIAEAVEVALASL